ncbi:hypothetical protein JTE90_025321 [Oedothorax gibbosus]|uniref:Uncharacterized protein n=1 Tax=Oedothorax gibbosus TaxID=931172 RepID=A0AAV6V8X0_9ARAC|nr:hypothetical protein JTE90_025321 [Oedothorax gibbosus]
MATLLTQEMLMLSLFLVLPFGYFSLTNAVSAAYWNFYTVFMERSELPGQYGEGATSRINEGVNIGAGPSSEFWDILPVREPITLIGTLTQFFMERPKIPGQYGEGATNRINEGRNIGAGPSSEFWDILPVREPITLDSAVRIIEKSRKDNRKYSAQEIEYYAMIDPDRLPPQARGATLGSSLELVQRLFQMLIDRAVADLVQTDLIRFVIMSNELDKPISTHLRLVRDMNVEAIMACVLKVLQSKDTITLDEGFTVNIITVKRPRGAGRNRPVVNLAIDRLKKGSVITIREDAIGLCCAMAILLGKAIHENDKDLFTLKRKDCQLLMRRAIKLHTDTGVEEGPCGYEQIGVFRTLLGYPGHSYK